MDGLQEGATVISLNDSFTLYKQENKEINSFLWFLNSTLFDAQMES